MSKEKISRPPLSYVISVSLGTGCYRHIRLDADDTLYRVSEAILKAFEFDNDHLHAFFMDNKTWSQNKAACYWLDADKMRFNVNPSTGEVTLRQLALPMGHKFLYLFDYGDEWRFSCRVLKILEEETVMPQVLRSVGEAPDQY